MTTRHSTTCIYNANNKALPRQPIACNACTQDCAISAWHCGEYRYMYSIVQCEPMPTSRPAIAYAVAYGISSSLLAFPGRAKRARTTLKGMSLSAQIIDIHVCAQMHILNKKKSRTMAACYSLLFDALIPVTAPHAIIHPLPKLPIPSCFQIEFGLLF